MPILGVILVVSGFLALQIAARALAIAAWDSPSRRRAVTVRTTLNDHDCGWSN